ncbi:oligosaccharide flippase family protein [Candidatus Gottesmanbacteria bacterium]|nr:oligosaccharide flippase family protein [Candidatus Gottesmanbacteria bacterium]
MPDIDIELIKRRSVVGVVALTARTFLLQIVAFAATFLLTLFLSPDIFGVFYVISAIISFLAYFSDIGLAAALVQKKEEVTREDLSTTFIIQQALVITLVLISLIFSGYIASFYRLDEAGVWLFRALAVSFFFSSLKTIPSVLLERRLAFDRLVIPHIVETLGFYGVAVYLAWKGFGITSFTWAVLIRGILGLITMYMVEPWVPTFALSRESARKLMRFGLPFQMNSFLALLKDDLLTVFLGRVLPFAHVGYIGWAKKWAEVPLRLIMDSVIRVTFPAYSRLQHDKKLLEKAIDKTMFGLSAAILPISTGLLFFVHPMVELIPKYAKWEPALVSFYLFVFSSAIAALSTPLMNALNAVGNIRTTLKFMVGWTIFTWAFTLLFMQFFGYNGVALALLVVSLSITLVIREAKKITGFSFIDNTKGPVAAAVIQGIFYWQLLPAVPHTFPVLLVSGISGVILYGGVMGMLEKNRINAFISTIRRSTQ